MDKEFLKAFLERQIENNQKEYESVSNLSTMRIGVAGVAKQMAIDRCKMLDIKLHYLQFLFFALDFGKKNTLNTVEPNQLRETKWASVKFLESEIEDIKDELFYLEGMIRDEAWIKNWEKEKMLSDRESKKKELEFWQALKEYLEKIKF